MPHPPSDNRTVPLPRWLFVVASVAIVFHFGSVGVRILAAPSGPWPMGGEGSSQVNGPQFAVTLANTLPKDYLKAISLDYNYHFSSNSPGALSLALQAQFKNAAGEDTTLIFPDPNANFWVRHRQAILANQLGNDLPYLPPQTRQVAAPGREIERVTIWRNPENQANRLELKTVPVLDLPRDQMNLQPNPQANLFAAAYARYLCRQHGVSKVQIIRRHQPPIPSVVLVDKNIPESFFDPIFSYFGELPQ
jgi:hypothetical protein